LDLGDASPYQLDKHCFTARRHVSRLHSAPYDRSSWNDESLLRSIYFPEVEKLVKKVTGCKKVVTTVALIRSDLYSEPVVFDAQGEVQPTEDGNSHIDFVPQLKDEPISIATYGNICPPIIGNRNGDRKSPAPKVHIDYTPRGARHHIRKHHRDLALVAEPVIEAENSLLRSGIEWGDLKDHYYNEDGAEAIPRFALFSVWRPLKTVTRDPLGIAPCFSFPKADYVTMEFIEVSFDNDIPPHLSEIIKPSEAHAQISKDSSEKEPVHSHQGGDYPTWGYLAHAPNDKEEKAHDWHFLSDHQTTEVFIIQLFDNKMEATVRAPQDAYDTSPALEVCGAPHASFTLEGQEEGGARESIEIRCAAFW
jgi:hypothetical protein